MSSYVQGIVDYDKIIKDVGIENLDVILSGPMPENPSEILINKKIATLIQNLKNNYDIIILDSPPLGLVADSLTLMNFSDINLYMIRQSYTSKNLLSYSEDLYLKNRLGEIYLIFNDVKEGSGVYGYAYEYSGYGYGYKFDYGSYYSESNYEKL